MTLTISATHDREQHMRAILPRAAESAAHAAALYTNQIITVTDQAGVVRSAFAVWIAPLGPGAALPPGIQRWPAPGEAVISPQLRSDLASHPADLFGKVVATIGPTGLEVPTERRVYIRPAVTPVEAGVMTPISGFGKSGIPGNWGVPTLNAQPTWVLVLMVGGLLIAPALVALILASGLGAEARLMRTRQLQAMGSTSVHVAWLDIAEAWPALTAGSGFALTVVGALGVTGLSAPALDLLVPASQWRSWWPQAALALVLAHVIAIAVLLMTRIVRRRWSRQGPGERRQQPPVFLAITCLVAGMAAIRIPAESQSAQVRSLGYHVSVLVVVATLPALLATLLAAVGQTATRYGTRRGVPSAILGGRRLSTFPVRTARLMGGLTGAILLFGQVQLNASTLGQEYQLAQAGRARYGDVVMSASRTTFGTGLASFLAKLPSGVEPVWTSIDVSADGSRPTYRVDGSCEALRALSLPCRPATGLPQQPNRQLLALSASIGFSPSDSIRISPTPSADLGQLRQRDAQLSLVSMNGADLPVDELQRADYHLVPGGLGLASVGDTWVSAGTKVAENQRWVVTWGLYGILPLIAVAGLVLAADTLTSARETAPLAALFDRRRWLFGVSAWRVWLPVTMAGVFAALAYLVLPASMSAGASGATFFTPSDSYAWASAAMCVGLGLVLAGWSAWSTATAATRWRPGQDARAVPGGTAPPVAAPRRVPY